MTRVGLAGLLLDPPGDDADHAGMPAAPGEDHDRAVVLAGELRLGRFLDRGLDRAPLFVERVQLRGDGAGFVRIVAGQQAHAERRLRRPGRRR